MNTYWYFEFVINNFDTGLHEHDHTVVSSADQFFPVANVFAWKDEEFGENSQLIIKSVVQITEEDYVKMDERIEAE